MNYENEPSAAFYEQHYKVAIGGHLLGKQRTIGQSDPRRCRFCGKQKPEVSFRKKAHALPELVGNHVLVSLHECDSCNELFGRTIEDSFAKWTAFQRLVSGIGGKRGVPSYKSKDRKVECDANKGSLNVVLKDESTSVDFDPVSRRLTMTGDIQPHIPRFAYKCLVKMALSVMPDEDVMNFRAALEWLRLEDPAQDRYRGGFCRVL